MGLSNCWSCAQGIVDKPKFFCENEEHAKAYFPWPKPGEKNPVKEPVPTFNYKQRLEQAVVSLQEVYDSYKDEANSGHPDSLGAVREQIRIAGKIEGVKLALSYLREY